MKVTSKKNCPKTVMRIISLLILGICTVQIAFNAKLLKLSPFTDKYIWRSPSYVAVRGDELCVIDSNKRNVSLVDKNNLICSINADESGFSAVGYAVSDGKYIYAAGVVYASSGTRVCEEAIKRFDREGKYVDTVFSRRYKPQKEKMPAQNGYVLRLDRYEDRIFFIYYDKTIFSVNEIKDGGVIRLRTLYSNVIPDIWNASYSAYDDTVWIAGKNGKIYYQTGCMRGFDYFSADFAESSCVFIDVSACGKNVYAADVISHRVFNIASGESVIDCADPLDGMFINKLSAYEHGAAVTDGESVILATDGGGIIYREVEARYKSGVLKNVFCTWTALLILCAAAAVLLILILIFMLKNSRSKYTGTALTIAFAVIVSTVLISGTVLEEMFARLSSEMSGNLKKTAMVIAAGSSENGLGDAVDAIKTAADYNSADYMLMRSCLDKYCDAAYDCGSNMYYTVQKFDGDFFYGIADYEDTIGAVFPSDHFETSYYRESLISGDIFVMENEEDEFGVWSFVTAPLRNSSGETVAVVELGVNMIAQRRQNQDIVAAAAIRIVVIILLIILLLVEGTVLMNGISGFRTERDPDTPYFLRSMVFLTFFASNLSAAFIPQLSREIFNASGFGYGGTVVSALPMSLQLFATAAAALLCGSLFGRFSAKPLLLSACGIQTAGYAVIALGAYLPQYIPFCAGHLISGFGIGITVVLFNTMPDRVKDEGIRNSFYSGLNAGVISGVVIGLSIGSYIADTFGYAFTFAVSAAAVFFIVPLICISVRNEKVSRCSERPPCFRGTIGAGSFIKRADVLSFVICVMIPMLIMMYFKDYLFPLYAGDAGMSDTDIGNILLFAGAVSIVFGTAAADGLLSRCGSFGTVSISSLITSACLILFGLFPSVNTAIAVVFVLSLSAGFGLAGMEVYYSLLPAFGKYGAKRAMSLYSIFDNASQTAAPMLIGALMTFGCGGCLLLGGSGILLYFVFLIIRMCCRKGAENDDRIPYTNDK